MIDIRKLKELVRLMVANELTELDLRDTEEQVLLRRGTAAPPSAPAVPAPAAAPVVVTPAVGTLAATPAPSPEEDDGLHRITSPMVGTFFSAASPDAAPFVSVGTEVDPETVVCIVEAMKIFNEIKAEVSGTIQKVMVKNGDAVEFGQPLFSVQPS